MTPTKHQPAPLSADAAMQELYKLLLKSERFINWKPAADEDKPPSISNLEQSNICMDEKHFTPEELSEAWSVSIETIRSIFRDEPGVLKIGKTGTKYKRGYITLRIPHAVAARVHARLTA
jgi:hypothetical protein